MRNRAVFLVALVLIAVGSAIVAFKVRSLGLPLLPHQDTAVWTVEARARFKAEGGPLKATLRIPLATPGFEVIDEDFISSNYGLAVEQDELDRSAIWTVRRARGQQSVYYRLTVVDDGSDPRHEDPHPGYPKLEEQEEAIDSAIQALLRQVRLESADIASFARGLIRRLNRAEEAPGGAVELLNDGRITPSRRAAQIVELLSGARIPARIVWGVVLEDGARDGQLVPWIEVHNEQTWIPFDPMSGEQGYPSRFLAWKIGTDPLLELEGAERGEVRFAVAESVRGVVDVAAQRAEARHAFWFDFSLFSLPVQTQNVYRILLMVPLGAFLVVVLRCFVGIETFGTFMPVLIALAFRETQLGMGIVLFVTIVGLGLVIRFLLERLQLLLVPRLTTVLIVVVLLMVGVSILTFQAGLDRGISVALFPMVILAMTIERMSLVWEELGGRQAMMQGLGSLLVAAGGYLVLTNELLIHLVFVFPEILFIVLAVTLLAGRYTGYRLLELWRFRGFLGPTPPGGPGASGPGGGGPGGGGPRGSGPSGSATGAGGGGAPEPSTRPESTA